MYFWNKTVHVSDSSYVHHQEFFTVHSAMVYVIQVCWELASRIRMELQFRPDSCVRWKTPDDGHRNCPKHVEFYSKNKFEELVHLVGFITRIYHDARSPERQILAELANLQFHVIWYSDFSCYVRTDGDIPQSTGLLSKLFIVNTANMKRLHWKESRASCNSLPSS